MSKPNKPSGNQGRRRQNPNKKPAGKQPIDATAESASTIPAPEQTIPALAETVPAPADTVSALAETVPAPAETVLAPASTIWALAETVPAPADAVSAPAAPVPAPANTAPAPANTFSSGIQTIAAAYGDYTKKSFEDTKCFVEKLARVRSFDKAVEVQAEYAKTAYETFVAESQKIRGLYSDLAKQSFKPFAGFAPKAPRATR
jgi:hypothetical protein